MRMTIDQSRENRRIAQVNDFGSRWNCSSNIFDCVPFYHDYNMLQHPLALSINECTTFDCGKPILGEYCSGTAKNQKEDTEDIHSGPRYDCWKICQLCIPPHPLPKRGDMRDMVPAVPGIQL